MEPRKAFLASPFSSLLIFFLIITSLCGGRGSSEEHRVKVHKGPVVEKDQRSTLLVTEFGEISATTVKDGHGSGPPYHLQLFTLEPNSVFLPVLLHTAMVFYVHTGSGRLTWANEDGTSTIDLREGDVCSLGEGSVFYIHSNLEAERKKLRINAMFANTQDSTYDPSIGAYSRINKLVKGFDKKIMQAAFKVPKDLIEAITNKTDTPAIVHASSEKKHNTVWGLETLFLKYIIDIRSNSKKHKTTYNIFDNDPDFKNRHGWTSTVTKKQLKQLKRHNTGFLMVNLTMGSMLGPHWNPRATEVAVVLQGKGMVRVVCGSNNDDKTECQNMRFRVKQGDIFVVPRFHPVAHMSFNKEPLVFMGFSTAAKENHPQFLAGKGSVLQILDKQIVATSFGVGKTTIDKILASKDDSIIFECSSCAEEEEKIMKEEKEKEKEEEEERKKKEKEEKEKKREEEEAKEREKKEEKKERRRKKEEEEEVRRREEERKREEEEARRQQEEREWRREEEEARRQEEARREQEEARREREEVRREREREREEEAEREQEKARKQEEKREKKREEEARREKEEEEARREREKEEEETRREREREREEEAEREREAARKQKERREEREREESATRRQQKKREMKRKEEEARRERERKREEEVEREGEAARKQEERREEAEKEEAAARRQQEKRERRREEEEARREKEESRREQEVEREQERGRRQEGRGREEAATEEEEEAARRQQEERERKREGEEASTEEEREKEREKEQTKRERGRGWRRQRGREEGGEESAAEWEEEEAKREQEERERRREQDSYNKYIERDVKGKSKGRRIEGKRVRKMQNV